MWYMNFFRLVSVGEQAISRILTAVLDLESLLRYNGVEMEHAV